MASVDIRCFLLEMRPGMRMAGLASYPALTSQTQPAAGCDPGSDLAAPSPGGVPGILDELLEALRVSLDLAVIDTGECPRVFREAVGLPVDLDHHPSLGLVQTM